MFINSHHKKANALFEQQKYDKAIIEYTKALELSPNNANLLSLRGVTFLHLSQKKECLDDMLLALNLEPENAYRHASLAYCLDFFGDTNGAVKAYEKAVELDPDDAIAHNNLGLLLEKQGYQKKAQEKFERADKLADIEKKLFNSLDELEQNTEAVPEESPQKNVPEGEKLQPKKMEVDPKPSRLTIFRSIFTSKAGFKEFIVFVKNGFKINDSNSTK